MIYSKIRTYPTQKKTRTWTIKLSSPLDMPYFLSPPSGHAIFFIPPPFFYTYLHLIRRYLLYIDYCKICTYAPPPPWGAYIYSYKTCLRRGWHNFIMHVQNIKIKFMKKFIPPGTHLTDKEKIHFFFLGRWGV